MHEQQQPQSGRPTTRSWEAEDVRPVQEEPAERKHGRKGADAKVEEAQAGQALPAPTTRHPRRRDRTASTQRERKRAHERACTQGRCQGTECRQQGGAVPLDSERAGGVPDCERNRTAPTPSKEARIAAKATCAQSSRKGGVEWRNSSISASRWHLCRLERKTARSEEAPSSWDGTKTGRLERVLG